MAKTSGALFSTDARGSISGITYQHGYRRKICRGKPHPLNRKSPAQLIVRNIVSKTVIAWQSLHEEKKQLWREYVNGSGNTGYHAFIQQYISRTIQSLWQYELPPSHGYCTTGNHQVGEFLTGGDFISPT